MHVDFREYEPRDASALRRCVVELQEFERTIDCRLRPGEEIADAYCEQLHSRCCEAQGRILVAEQSGTIVGFVAVLAREPFTELDDPPGTYALVTDLAVLKPWRGHGIGRHLLHQAEAYARESGAVEMRVGVLSRNVVARGLYRDIGFEPHLETLVKRLT